MLTDGYDRPEIYDLITGEGSEDVEFYRKQVALTGGPILEIACGTGRVLNQIAASTRENCVGLDLSPSMVEMARIKAQRLHRSVDFLIGDMQDFSLESTFGFIFIPMNSLLHLPDQNSILKTFACVKRHLRKDGRFTFSIFNPSEFILGRNPSERFQVMNFVDPSTSEVVKIEETTSYNRQDRINTTTWFYSSSTRKDFYIHQYRLQVIYPLEIKALITKSGFELVKVFGNYDLKPFENHDRLQIYSLRVL